MNKTIKKAETRKEDNREQRKNIERRNKSRKYANTVDMKENE